MTGSKPLKMKIRLIFALLKIIIIFTEAKKLFFRSKRFTSLTVTLILLALNDQSVVKVVLEESMFKSKVGFIFTS